MALRFSRRAASTIALISARCCTLLRPGLLGQSMLATVATHIARNSRGAGGGCAPVIGDGGEMLTGAFEGCDEQAASKPSNKIAINRGRK
jgi:hypothetical protein